MQEMQLWTSFSEFQGSLLAAEPRVYLDRAGACEGRQDQSKDTQLYILKATRVWGLQMSLPGEVR